MNPRTFPQLLATFFAVLATVGIYAYAFSEELPVGALRGRLLAADTREPLAGINIVVRPISPKDGQDTLLAETESDGSFVVPRLPAGQYDLSPSTSAYQNRVTRVTVSEGKTVDSEIKLDPGDPYLNLNIHEHAHLPGDNPRVALNGFRQGDNIQLQVYSTAVSTVLEEGSNLRGLLTPVSRSRKLGNSLTPADPRVKLVKSIDHKVAKRNAEGVFYDFEHLGKLAPGLYLLRAEGEKNEAHGWLMVTDLALITKSAEGKVLAFAVNLRTGAPEPGARLVFYRQNKRLKEATTNTAGRAEISIPEVSAEEVAAVAHRGDSVAFMRFNPFGSAYYGESGNPPRYRVYTYTERPVYRPGHRVLFKGVARLLQREGYGLPSPRTVGIEVQDEQQTTIYRGSAPMNEHGSFAGGFQLSEAAQGGMYLLTTTIDGEENTDTFAVASYRKPEWSVEVTTPQKSYIRGESVTATVSAQYYYGAPVVNGTVSYTVYRSQYWSYWDEAEEEYDDESEEHGGLYGEVVDSGETKTDAAGNARIHFSTAGLDPKETGDYQYMIEANVSDLSDRTAAGEHTIRVSAGEYLLDARPSRYVSAPTEEVTVDVRLEDLEEKPVSGAPVHMMAALQVWDRKGVHEKVLASSDGATNAKGQVSFPITLTETGSVVVRLTTTDPRGNRIETTTDVWVTSYEGGDYGGSYPSLSLVPDKKEYRIGDTAQVLINTDKLGATAIVSTEAERVLDLKTLPLKRKSTVVRFPIKKGYEPNVYVTACYVVDREFVTNQVLIRVDPKDHRLKVTVESDREEYRPGDTATYRIKTFDASGRPVPAEVSFGVVDEAVYAVREESSRGLWEAFYPRRYNEVGTEFSYPRIYLGDADKEGSDVTVRTKFPDTAHWDPFLRTSSAGEAPVRVTLPDSLTSWRATVVAHSDRTQIGKETHNVRVAKELTLRLQTPRSITEGDVLTVSAIAHNYTKSAQDVSVELSATGVELKSGARQQARLQPEEAKRFEWEVRAAASGEAVFTAKARAGAFSDGVQLPVPVRPFARMDVMYRAGAVTDETANEEFELDGAAAGGEAEIRVSPSLAGAMLGSLDYLATYPYGCVEQTMSGFLPDVVLLQLFRDFNVGSSELRDKVPAMTTAGLLRLYSMQNESGGWGWWRYDEPDAWMTAYVMFGLSLAQEAGTELNSRIRDNGLSALKEIARREKLDPNEAMFVAYALAVNGARQEATTLVARFEKQLGKLQRRAQGYRILALVAAGGARNRERAEAGMRSLWNVVDETGGLYHWSEIRAAGHYGYPQDVESTAVVLKAALAVDAEEGRLPGVVRWLLLKRNGNHWVSTRDTAWILFALPDYLKPPGELKPDYRLSVLLNGKELRSEVVSPQDALEEETVIRVPLRDLADRNRLEVRKEGDGVLYYSLRLTQELRTPSFKAESTVKDLSLTREYFRLRSKRDAVGRIITVPEEKPTRSFQVGDRIMVRLTIATRQRLEYLMLEDPLPAGCEVQERGDVARYDWLYWWSDMEARDDRMAFFFRNLEPGKDGKVELDYYLRPEHTGRIVTLPGILSDMYNPAIRASTAEDRLEVRR
ncbi:MAG: alpha-2-macroglobulin family protein [Actinomycetota bacterium]